MYAWKVCFKAFYLMNYKASRPEVMLYLVIITFKVFEQSGKLEKLALGEFKIIANREDKKR